jgi:hypothetical protein
MVIKFGTHVLEDLNCKFYYDGLKRSDIRRSKSLLNKVGNARITQHCGAFVEPLLPWKRNSAFPLYC